MNMPWQGAGLLRAGIGAAALGILAACGAARGAEPKAWRLGEGHDRDVTALAFAPDGRALATADDDGFIKVWDRASGRVRATFRGHARWRVEVLAFSADGSLLASGARGQTRGGEARLWDVTAGALRAELLGPLGAVAGFAFTPDGQLAALGPAAGEGRGFVLMRWEAATGKLHGSRRFELDPDGMHRAALSPDGATVALGTHKAIELRDAATGEVRATLGVKPHFLQSLVFSADGAMLAAGWGILMNGSRAGPWHATPTQVVVWDLTAREPRERWTLDVGPDQSIHGVAFSPDGKTLATAPGYGRDLSLWDLATGRRRAQLDGTGTALAFAPDGKTLAANHFTGVKLWDVESGRSRSDFDGPTAEALAYSPDGTTLAAGLSDGTVALRDLAADRVRLVLQGHDGPVTSVAFAPDGTRLAAGSATGGVSVWEPDSGRLRVLGGPGAVSSLAFAPDGKTLAVGRPDGTVELARPAPGFPGRRTLRGHAGPVVSLAFAPDGKTLASGGQDGATILWDVAEGRERGRVAPLVWHPPKNIERTQVIDGEEVTVRTIDPAGGTEDIPVPIAGLAYSPDGKTLAVGTQDLGIRGRTRLVDVASGTPRLTIEQPHEKTPWGVLIALAISPDGTLLATADDHGATLRDLATGRTLGTAVAFSNPSPAALAFAPDGKTLALAHHQRVELWAVAEILRHEPAR